MTAALFSGVPLGSWLGGAFGWRVTFWTIAAVGAVAAVGLLATAPAVSGSAPAPLRERLAPLRDRAVLRLVTVTFLAASGGLMFYTYLGTYTAEVAGGSYGLLSFVLFLVGAAGLVGALLAGRATDLWGPQRSLRRVLAGHAITLALTAGLIFSGIGNRYVLTAVIACWAVFAWALTPPVQGSILTAAGPAAGMTALSLNISGLYLGTGVAAAVGGALVGTLGVPYVPLAATVLMALAFLLSPSAPRAEGVAGQAVGSNAVGA